MKNSIASLFVSVSSSNDHFWPAQEVIELAELKCGSECSYSLLEEITFEIIKFIPPGAFQRHLTMALHPSVHFCNSVMYYLRCDEC